MHWVENYKKELAEYNQFIVGNHDMLPSILTDVEKEALLRKKELLKKRRYEIVKSMTRVQEVGKVSDNENLYIDVSVHHQYVLRQDNQFYIEEEMQLRTLHQDHNERIKLQPSFVYDSFDPEEIMIDRYREKPTYTYDRRAAVQYAEKWWNSYNPQYKHFNVDCTNYVSQCMYAGGAPMRGFGNRNEGWWYRHNNWSYSWAVAHSLRWYLGGSQQGLQARAVEKASELTLGDIICYDFEGDGRFDHTTIVVAKDSNNEPLVNAHTSNSRMRYWSYEDSTAWTPNIKYKFFHIIDKFS